MKIRKIINLLILFGLVFVICSCGEQTQNNGQNNTSEPPITEPTEPVINEHEHSFTVGEQRESTCMESGFIEYVCECGESYSEELPLLEHSFNEWEIIEPATNEQPGLKIRFCENCGISEEMHYEFVCEHVYEDTVVEATCTKGGYTSSKCKYCNDEYIKDEVQALGHLYTEDVIEPTCLAKGYTLHECDRCGYSYKDTYTNKLTHNATYYEYKEPTCSEEGSIEGFYCDLCESYFVGTIENCYNVESLIISPSGHSYNTVTTDPTCDEQGFDKHTCVACGDSYVDNYVSATGHNYNELYYDSTHHYKKCSCGSCQEKIEHTFIDNLCSVCKVYDSSKIHYNKRYTDNDEQYYAVNISASNDAIIYIPEEYEGLPVKAIDKIRGGYSINVPGSITIIEEGAFEYAEFDIVNYLGTIEQYLNIEYNGYDSYFLVQARFLYFNGVELKDDLVIPEGVKNIPDYAFSETKITSVTIPSTVKKIGFRAFYYCGRLSQINIPDDNSLESISSEAFYQISGKALNHLEDASYITTPNNDKFILYSVAYDNKNTTSFEIDPKTKFIYERAFEFCEQLERITIPDTIVEIGEGAFWYCINLRNIVLPEGLTEIKKDTFYNNDSLNTLEIPKTVTYIGESAFSDCESLTSMHIPSNVKEIDSYAFLACINLTDIILEEGLEIIRQNSLSYIGVKELILPNSLKVIEGNILADSVLEKLSLPYLKNEEYSYDYYGLKNILNTIPDTLKEVNISSGDIIDARYFKDCSSIESIYLPDNIKGFINEDYYNITFNDNVFNTYENNMYIGSINNPYLLLFELEDNQTDLTLHKDFKVTTSNLFINENIEKVYYEGSIDTWLDVSFTTMTSTPMYCAKEFYILNESNTFEEVTTLRFDESIEVINQYQFHGFKKVKDVYLPKSVVECGERAFGDLSSVNVYYDGTIEDWLNISFKGEDANPGNYNSRLYQLVDDEYVETTNLVIPVGTVEIGMYQFDGFNHIEQLTMPSSVKEIKEHAFTSIASNKTYYSGDISDYLEINFANQMSTFASGEFYILEDSNYKELTSLVIPSGIEVIKQYAFEGMPGLVEVYLPLSLNKINNDVFLNTNNIDDVYYEGQISNWCNINLRYVYSTPMHSRANFYMYNGTDYELLLELVIPNTVTKISNYQFYGFDVEAITIPFIGSEVDATNNNYFGYIFGARNYSSQNGMISSKLKTINVVNNTLTSIPENAFYGLNNVEFITIPENVTTFGNDAFKNCNSLKEINYLGNINNWCKSTFTSNYSNPLYYADKLLIDSKVIEGEVILEEGITTIPYKTFNYSNITAISMPSSLTKIQESAFGNCELLEKVNMAFDVNQWCKLEFGNSESNPMRFADNMYINNELISGDIILDDDIEIIPFGLFKNSLITSIDLPDSLSYIEGEVFENCESLNTVKYIDLYSWCKDLTMESNPMDYSKYIYFNGEILDGAIVMDESITSIPFGTFINSNIEKLSLQFIGSNKYDEENDYIGYIFGAKSYELTNKVFPTTLKELEILSDKELKQYSLYGVSGIEVLTIPTIGNADNSFLSFIFGGASYEESQLIPTTLKTLTITKPISLSDYAFNNCSSIETINFKGIDSIGEFAFNNCSALKAINLPSDLNSIGNDAFNGCDALETISYENDVYNWCNIIFSNKLSNPMYNADHLTFNGEVLTGDIDLYNNNIIEIPYGTFKNSSIESLTVKTVGTGLSDMFGGVISNTITSVTTYDTIIPERAFRSFNTINKVVFMEKVTSFGSGAFTECSPEEVYYAYGAESFLNAEFNEGGYVVSLTISSCPMNGGAHFYYLSNNEWVELLDLVVNDGIEEITKYVIGGFKYIKNITIPNSVTRITYGSNSLENVNYLGTLEEWCGIYNNTIMRTASNLYFNGEIPSGDYVIDFDATYLPYGTFKNSNIESIVLPKTLIDIRDYVFADCSLLESITFSNSETIFSETAFDNTDIKNVYFGGSVSDWCNMDFENHTQSPMSSGADFYLLDENAEWYKVVDLVIPSDVQAIYPNVFYGFENIKSVTISSNLRGVWKDAFYNCTSLENVYFADLASKYGYINFNNETANPMYYATNFYALDENGEYYKPTEIVISEDIPLLGRYAYYNMKQLTNITLGDNVEEIADNAFVNCDNLIYSEYDNVYYLESVTNPYYYLVDEKVNAIDIIFHKDVKIIKEDAFVDTIIDTVYFDGSIEDYLNINYTSKTTNPCNNGAELYLLIDGNYELLTKLVLPDTYTIINQYQFYGVTSIIEVIMANTVTDIQEDAFSKCTNLEVIVLSSLFENLDTVSVFGGCKNIKGVCSYAKDVYEFVDTVNYIAISPIYNKTVYFYSEIEPEKNTGYGYWYLEDTTITLW